MRRILDDAASKAGLDDYGDDWFRAPLEAWVNDLESSALTDFGRAFLTRLVVRDLVRRLRVLRVLRENPEIREVSIPPIVYITGLERSGTTLLHNLVALHRNARPLLRWELMEPVPPPAAASYQTDARIARVQASLEKLRGSLLEHMHWVNADEPEECPWGFIDCVGMLGQAASMCMPTWRRFLRTEDLTPAYRNYRHVVQLLLWKNPLPQGGFLVLKSPQVARTAAQLGAVFPEARFVVTDRDPFRAMTSMLVMAESIVEPFCRDNPVTDDARRGRIGLSHLRTVLPGLSSLGDRPGDRVAHLAYPRLVREPIASVGSLLSELGVREDPALGSRIESFLAAQRAGRRARPPAQLPTMGYDHDEVLADPVAAAYCERFGVEPERRRMTG